MPSGYPNAKAVPKKPYPADKMLVVEAVLRTVSETCDSTAHEFYRGLQQLWNCSSSHIYVHVWNCRSSMLHDLPEQIDLHRGIPNISPIH